MDDKVRELKKRFRLAMNGVTSSYMREKGINYKLNFGVSLPTIKQIAQKYTGDQELADRLLTENVRESLIVATLIYPLDAVTPAKATEMASKIEHLEIAEQFSMNIFCKLPQAEALVMEWLDSDIKMVRIVGSITLVRTLMQGQKLSDENISMVIEKLCSTLERESNETEFFTAMNAIKRLGRVSQEVRAKIIDRISRVQSERIMTIKAELETEFAYYA
ncbi:MAG: DNA alkylation repair protein [Bacteroidales bacterium]